MKTFRRDLGLDGGVSYMPNQSAGFDKIPDGIADMIMFDEMDLIMEFYGVPALYKKKDEEKGKLPMIMLSTELISPKHQAVIDEYFVEIGTMSPGDFTRQYVEKETVRASDRKIREEIEEQRIEELRLKQLEEEQREQREKQEEKDRLKKLEDNMAIMANFIISQQQNAGNTGETKDGKTTSSDIVPNKTSKPGKRVGG